jgi:hypothetical protein
VPEIASNSLGESTFTLLNPKNEHTTSLYGFFLWGFCKLVYFAESFSGKASKKHSPPLPKDSGGKCGKKSRSPLWCGWLCDGQRRAALGVPKAPPHTRPPFARGALHAKTPPPSEGSILWPSHGQKHPSQGRGMR